MHAVPSASINVLWACHGTPASLEAADPVRRWLLPVAGSVDVLAVAPAGRPAVERVLPRSHDRRERDLQEAGAAAQRAIGALGQTDVTAQPLVDRGTPSLQIASAAARYDVVVVGAGARGGLGSTTTEVLEMTSRSVFVARPDQDGPVLIAGNTERCFRKAIEHMHRLTIDSAIAVVLLAVLEPAKPFGGMLLSFSEHVREQEQALHDLQRRELQAVCAEESARLLAEGRRVETLEMDRDRRDWPARLHGLAPSLVVVGDLPSDGHARHPEDIAVRVAAEAPCSVLVAR